eukprot:6560166-Prymnesium_polylepis.1
MSPAQRVKFALTKAALTFDRPLFFVAVLLLGGEARRRLHLARPCTAESHIRRAKANRDIIE